MRVVVNAAFLSGDHANEYLIFLSGTFKHIAHLHEEYHFIFFCERHQADHFNFGNNAEVYLAKSGKKNTLTRKYWFDIKIPALLRRYKADLFFSPDALCLVNTKLPQCILINDPLFLHRPGLYTKKQLRFYNKYAGKALQKAKAILALSTNTKNKLTNNFSTAAGKIDTIYNGVCGLYKDQTGNLKEEIKLKYTEGKEFFYYIESFYPNGNLINLLKAFSLFKKRQQSNFQLIIYRRSSNADPSFIAQLEKYKYKADVKIIDNSIERDALIILSSAYAFIYPVFTDDFCFSIIASMKMGIPIITSLDSAMQELTAGAALCVNPEDPQHIAESMMRIYKDEKLRNELIEKSKTVAASYTTEKTAEQLWHLISKCLD